MLSRNGVEAKNLGRGSLPPRFFIAVLLSMTEMGVWLDALNYGYKPRTEVQRRLNRAN
jgi:hypothetical protein